MVVGPRMAAIERLLAMEPEWMYDPSASGDVGVVLGETTVLGAFG